MLSYSDYIHGVLLTTSISIAFAVLYYKDSFLIHSYVIGLVFFLRNTQFQLRIRMKSMFNDDRFLEVVTELKHPVDVDIISKYDVIFNILNMVIRNSIKQI